MYLVGGADSGVGGEIFHRGELIHQHLVAELDPVRRHAVQVVRSDGEFPKQTKRYNIMM